ncbi:ribosome small subunit-dependent GTPase A [Sporolactobacillus inulinus]|uniref:Small ribosomal subunit biogenesis GTPase RsgA n=2 Tax=Sporolactobacillus inulinus TaxID=2078 RepID=A0A0U1QML7_9BACL|nr:ribosome small subunit-dependent GTPase A [Sporolactobacillus inulinus]KLI01846.1 GTPase RsgA [Sporolactobacillus inulinus CASD]GEB75862.1 putative ribosome biogenesis GTPase RsgA [Sporolactobacillus inulinus]
MPEGIIYKALSGFYYIKNGDQDIQCRARGIFRKRKVSPLVGDHVTYEAKKPSDGYILSIQARKNALKRPPIANIDQAILVFSVEEPSFDCQLLDRFLVTMEAHAIHSLICFTKKDLLTANDLSKFKTQINIYERIGYPVFFISSVTNEGISELKKQMAHRISVVTGQSGVGKSTLLNHLNSSLSIETQSISQALGRGKHTTRHTELIPIVEDGYIADTPGFSALEIPEIVSVDLENCFPEFSAYRDGCRFRGCTHLAEPNCRVKEAVSAGEIDQKRYAHYSLFFQELKERERKKYQ